MEDVDHLRFFLVVVKPPKVTIKFVDVYVCNTLLFLFCWVQYYFGFWLILYNQLTLTKFGRSLPLYINTIKRDFFLWWNNNINIKYSDFTPRDTVLTLTRQCKETRQTGETGRKKKKICPLKIAFVCVPLKIDKY